MSIRTQVPGEPRPDLTVDAVMDQARSENFPVASRLLPKRYREHLLAVYGFARFVDDVGDREPGDRLAHLDWVDGELGRAFDGSATHPVFRRLGETVNAIAIDRVPFDDLIAANRQDQVVARYERYEDLAQYCALSANPVGRIVLAIFGCTDEDAFARSDEVCTALQLVEHWQDIKEDFAVDRIYLPREDLQQFEVREGELGAPTSSDGVRRLVAFEVGRARALLSSGSALVAMMSGYGRVAVAGFVGGGHAQLDAIERHSFDVLSVQIKASPTGVARRAFQAYFGRAGAQ